MYYITYDRSRCRSIRTSIGTCSHSPCLVLHCGRRYKEHSLKEGEEKRHVSDDAPHILFSAADGDLDQMVTLAARPCPPESTLEYPFA